MKAFRFFVVALLIAAAFPVKAQVSVNVNIGAPPAWGPAGYTDVRYYYLPDVAMYYDVSSADYIYLNNGGWVRTRVVPPAYRNYNFYNGYKVVLTDYRGATPFVYYKTHKVKYPRGYHPARQKTIGLPPGHARKAMAYRDHGHGPKVKGHHHDKGHHGKGHGPGKH